MDTYDIAMLAVLRVMNQNAYCALDFESTVLSLMTDEGGESLIGSRIKHRRVNEAMTGYSRSKKGGNGTVDLTP
jgi:hypothetical protein